MQRNRAQICSFFVKGECKRGAECPYRHEMPTTGDLANQNIKDRYFGVNDPVARKMMNRVDNMPKLTPPEDTTITTLYVGEPLASITMAPGLAHALCQKSSAEQHAFDEHSPERELCLQLFRSPLLCTQDALSPLGNCLCVGNSRG